MRYALLSASMLCVALSACAASPEEKVKQMEEKNAALEESSGYNECMRKIDADYKKLDDCIQLKLVAAGYTDGIDCIANYNEAPCKDTTRYNKQIDAKNVCADEVTFETNLGQIDCMQMLLEAKSR